MENKKHKILVVDDENDLCQIVRYNLERDGYAVEVANTAFEALQKDLSGFDLLLLDVMMDGMSGFDLANRLKNNPDTANIPIIFLTAKDSEEDVLRGFGLGADDYIAKPFRVLELLARIKAVLARFKPKGQNDEEILQYEGIIVNLNQKKVTVDGKDVPFTKTEFEILWLLLSVKGRVLSRQELIDRIWPDDVEVMDRTVDVNITRIRRKLESYSSHIATRLGYGYYFSI